MLRDAAAVARIDCLQSFARLACERRYVRPVLDDGASGSTSARAATR